MCFYVVLALIRVFLRALKGVFGLVPSFRRVCVSWQNVLARIVFFKVYLLACKTLIGFRFPFGWMIYAGDTLVHETACLMIEYDLDSFIKGGARGCFSLPFVWAHQEFRLAKLALF